MGSTMKEFRVIGNTIEKIAKEKNISLSSLAEKSGCSDRQFLLGVKGRNLFSFSQIEKIADALNESVSKLIPGDEDFYNKNYVDCVNSFSNPKNMDDVLDIIYDYLDIIDYINADTNNCPYYGSDNRKVVEE